MLLSTEQFVFELLRGVYTKATAIQLVEGQLYVDQEGVSATDWPEEQYVCRIIIIRDKLGLSALSQVDFYEVWKRAVDGGKAIVGNS